MTIIYKVICRECKKVFETSFFDDNYICHKCTWNPYNDRAVIPYNIEQPDRPWWKFW